jgi:hypothetical protein
VAKVEVAEHILAQIWKRQLIDSGKLINSSNDALKVIYPGRENRDRGPDFVDAVIVTSGKEAVRGDVEIHSRAGDWTSHGHDRDHHYNRVILHVVWEGESEVVLKNGEKIPTLSLRNCLKGSLEDVRYRLRFPEVPSEPCHNTGRSLGNGELRKLLDEAGEERFRLKASVFAAEIDREMPSQVLYVGIMGALGYAKNKEPFEELACSLPLVVLGRVCRVNPGEEQVQVLKALLLGKAGFLDEGKDEGLKRIWHRLGDGRTMDPQCWRTFRVRPENHPARRLIGAAYLIARFIESGLLQGVLRSINEYHVEVRRIERSFMVDIPETKLNKRYVLIGEGRARELVVNVVLPFVVALSEANGQVMQAQRAWALYRSYPKAGEYGITRELAGLLTDGGSSRLVNSARRQQGLIAKTYCHQRRCAGCPVTTALNARLLAS